MILHNDTASKWCWFLFAKFPSNLLILDLLHEFILLLLINFATEKCAWTCFIILTFWYLSSPWWTLMSSSSSSPPSLLLLVLLSSSPSPPSPSPHHDFGCDDTSQLHVSGQSRLKSPFWWSLPNPLPHFYFCIIVIFVINPHLCFGWRPSPSPSLSPILFLNHF